MTVSTDLPFKIVYSLFQHQYLGYLFESFAVQLDEQGGLTLRFQNISHANANEFAAGLDQDDLELIKLMDAMQQDMVAKRYASGRRLLPTDFFLKVYDPKTGDKILQETIAADLERKRARIMELLRNASAGLPGLRDKWLFEMANDGNPVARRIAVEPNQATIWFHFKRNEDHTVYYPTMYHQGAKVDFQHRNAMLICYEPAWMLFQYRLYTFPVEVDGKKIQPFLRKGNITIPKHLEDKYYEKFILPLVEVFDVKAQGFQIHDLAATPKPKLFFSEVGPGVQSSMFGPPSASEPEEGKMAFKLQFAYERFTFRAENQASQSASMEKHGDDYVFYRVKRQLHTEREAIDWLATTGLNLYGGKVTLDKPQAFAWLQRNTGALAEKGFIVQQSDKDGKRYFMGQSQINLEAREGMDWFDIVAQIRFGEYEIPFLKLRKLILARQREFELPNGEIAVIPEAWFTQYTAVLGFMTEANGGLTLPKLHLALLADLQNGELATVTMTRKLQKLQDFEQIDEVPLPQGFRGELRPYQKAGYNWLNFLREYNFGGCLADDMGLGKTVQTLALLQAEAERGTDASQPRQASLLVMPTSLLYNWQVEARKFTPRLRVMTYTGSNRAKNAEQFAQADVVLTSYGIVRLDAEEVLANYYFNYVILDESQAIKNPDSIVAKAVRKLHARHRLVLTGTPIENSTLDLWSQMSFVNPGLLGSRSFFLQNFLHPIEKKADIATLAKLQAIIKPFVLRRHKSQVATELPEKLESVQYVSMSPEQEEEYERVKSHYRNTILEHIEQNGLPKSQILVLQGLAKLRQIANHPRMVDPAYQGTSGKLRDVMHLIETAVAEKHKMLVFSQFVKHLEIVKAELIARKICFAYLDGATKDRQAQVELFQDGQQNVPVFLISIKAGGTGLNLTAADYVFLLDPWWNPAVEAQAIDRAHRIGQKNKVLIYKFIARNTVEEKILLLQKNKQRLATDLVTTEESFVKNLTSADIEGLLM
jgi:superfamily II DNA or RNA helicase